MTSGGGAGRPVERSPGIRPTGLLPLVVVYGLFAAHDILRTGPEDGDRPLLWLAAVAITAALAAGVLLPGRVLASSHTLAVIVVLGSGYLLAEMSWTNGVPPGGDDWPQNSQPIGLMLLALRAKPWAVPSLYALDCVVVAVHDPAGVVGAQIAQLPILLASVFVALYVRPQMDSVISLRSSRLAAARAEAAASASIVVRDARLDWIGAMASPTLRALTVPRPLDDAERLKCRLLEAAIRDTLRAPALVGEPLDAVVHAARSRGVDVTLLDDGGAVSASEAARLRARVAELADGWDGPRVVARIQPLGRGGGATVFLTRVDGGVEHHLVPPGAPSAGDTIPGTQR